jgi:hypothetical protein
MVGKSVEWERERFSTYWLLGGVAAAVAATAAAAAAAAKAKN